MTATRRRLLAGAAALAAGALARRPRAARAQAPPRVVVVGGGFAGATCARALRAAAPRAAVTLVEPNETFVACPFSNLVVAGLRDLEAQRFGYAGVGRSGVTVARQAAVDVDPVARQVRLADGTRLPYDRLVLAPGIDLRDGGIAGYDAAAAEVMPHAWKAGAQTMLLRRKLEAMPDGGLVVLSAPAAPFRCPPGPYERASLVAHFLAARKPRAKLLVLDAKDQFSKQSLFMAAWQERYPGRIEWVPLSAGGRVTEVDARGGVVRTELDAYRPAVANIIPPQRAGAITARAGVADATGWCPVDPVTFESRLVPGVHVIGDAAIMGAMPKSAFAANAQAKVCAAAVAARLAGEPPPVPLLVNTCYSLVAPDYAISIAGVYRPQEGQLREVPGSGGVSPAGAPAEFRAREAAYAGAWFRTVTAEVYG
jgi:NADPH-dependent 2,4-dienoyl-CoA reductase/sulfur reductase-like enzyme